jgi:hypothetical protein
MNLTKQKLKKIIRECACEAMKEYGMEPEMKMSQPASVKVVKLGPMMDNMESNDVHGLFPGMSHDHHGEEVGMVRGNLLRMADKALEIRELADSIDEHDEWVREKVAVAAAMVDSIHGFLKYNKDE